MELQGSHCFIARKVFEERRGRVANLISIEIEPFQTGLVYRLGQREYSSISNAVLLKLQDLERFRIWECFR